MAVTLSTVGILISFVEVFIPGLQKSAVILVDDLQHTINFRSTKTATFLHQGYQTCYRGFALYGEDRDFASARPNPSGQ